jgi:hypothetical protein
MAYGEKYGLTKGQIDSQISKLLPKRIPTESIFRLMEN